jgi:hydrogenase nickel incorporation protein HypB
MCAVCGCGTATIAGAPDEAHPHHHHHHHHPHTHAHHAHDHELSDRAMDFGNGPAGVDIPGLSQARTIRIARDIMSKNAGFAEANRARLHADGVFALNFVSSPGSGKTSLLVRAIDDLKNRWPITVIEGDQQTSRDAERIRATGAPAVQINTGKGCHLDAHMVGHALDHLTLVPGGLLFIENAPRRSISARRTRWWCCRSPKARTSRSNIPTCLPPPISCC